MSEHLSQSGILSTQMDVEVRLRRGRLIMRRTVASRDSNYIGLVMFLLDNCFFVIF